MENNSCMPVTAPVAQRTEHRSSEPSVGGSIPPGSAWLNKTHWLHFVCQCVFVFYSRVRDALGGIITFPQRVRDAS